MELIKNILSDLKSQYALPVKIWEIPLEEIEFIISDQLFFEILLMEIRRKTISNESFRKKKWE